jgi:hypothetical protein
LEEVNIAIAIKRVKVNAKHFKCFRVRVLGFFSGKMNSEQMLINKWRDLNSVQQQFVLDFVDFIAQKSLPQNQSQARAQRTERVKQWMDWASDNSDDRPGLPDEALNRDSIYSED